MLAAAPAAHPPTRIAFAPILVFDAEAGLGGTTSSRSHLAVRSRFDQTPATALKLYLRLVGLSDLALPDLPYSVEDLAWGLNALGGAAVSSGFSRADPSFSRI
ncbi:MAG: hypothetical protein J6386_06375 [Candidatus Synoicihabitans palmerolidicus]|nr:hypothetical protein [Candidatus Synoicihabitans palmerolidicus]